MKLCNPFRCNRPKPVTKDELDERVVWIINSINAFGNRIMASLDTLNTDTQSALTAATSYIQDVNTEVAGLAQQIADLKAALASANLSPDQQTKVDSADATVQTIASSLSTADAAIKASQTAPAPSGDGSSE